MTANAMLDWELQALRESRFAPGPALTWTDPGGWPQPLTMKLYTPGPDGAPHEIGSRRQVNSAEITEVRLSAEMLGCPPGTPFRLVIVGSSPTRRDKEVEVASYDIEAT